MTKSCMYRCFWAITAFLAAAPGWADQADNGLAPEVTDLNARDISYTLEKKLPYLEKPFINSAPRDRKDGIVVGLLGKDGGDRAAVLAFARKLGETSENPKAGKTDSLLISYRGKLLLEAYYRRGRANYPHYQMSITKSYTALAVGRAIQLGHLSMEDLDRPVVSFLKELKPDEWVEGADRITLHEAMHMRSGIRLKDEVVKRLRRSPEQLRGQGQVQSYLANSDSIPAMPRDYKYQGSDPSMTMQVVNAVVPGTAETFIRKELLGPMGITRYHWQDDTSGLPKAAAGSSFRSRDMVKMGLLILGKGVWQGDQLIPAAFIEKATSPLINNFGDNHYGYFWWYQKVDVGGKTYVCKQGRGAGGQFIFVFPELDLIAVVTAHNKGMGTMLRDVPQQLVPAFL